MSFESLTEEKSTPPPKDFRIKSFIRRTGRISGSQRKIYTQKKELYLIPFTGSLMDPDSLFPNLEKIVLEIGFGMGDTTADIAALNLDTGYLGIEVHTPGIARLMGLCDKRELINVKIIEHDAFEVLTKMIPDESLDGIHLFFPDPWKKRKHHKRRFLNNENSLLLASKIKPGGYFFAATDWTHYGEQMHRVLENSPSFVKGEKEDMPVRGETKFEKRGIKLGHEIFEFYYIKR